MTPLGLLKRAEVPVAFVLPDELPARVVTTVERISEFPCIDPPICSTIVTLSDDTLEKFESPSIAYATYVPEVSPETLKFVFVSAELIETLFHKLPDALAVSYTHLTLPTKRIV